MDSVGGNPSLLLQSQNSSFQNYPSSSSSSTTVVKRSRKRGMSTVLEDRTNQPLPKRSSKVKAESSLHEMVTTSEYAARGDAAAGFPARRQH